MEEWLPACGERERERAIGEGLLLALGLSDPNKQVLSHEGTTLPPTLHSGAPYLRRDQCSGGTGAL